MYSGTTKDQPLQLRITHVEVEWVNLSEGSELRSPFPKHCGHFWNSAQLADSPWLHCGKPSKSPGFSLGLAISPSIRIQHTWLSSVHPIAGFQTQSIFYHYAWLQFTAICGICAGLHLLLKETSSKVPSLILRELRCMKRSHCLRFMVLTINTLTLKLFIYMTTGKSLTTSPKLVTS